MVEGAGPLVMSASARTLPVMVEGSGPQTLVFVHGWPDDARLWDAQVANFRHQYRCVRVTMPHFGGREGADGYHPHGYDFTDVAEMLAATVVSENRGDPVNLVLHDWGCVWGFLMQRKYPELVKRIVAMDVGHPAMFSAGWRSLPLAIGLGMSYQYWLMLAYWANRVTQGTHFSVFGSALGDWMARVFVRLTRPRLAHDGPTEWSRITAAACYPYHFFQSSWGVSFPRVGESKATPPSCPCLFLYGRRKLYHFHTRGWEAGLRARSDCTVTPLPCGHWLPVERPDDVNRAMQSWLASP